MKRGIKKFLEVCYVTGTILIGAAFLAFVAYLIALGLYSFAKGVKLIPADLPADTPSEGVAWIMPEAGEVPVWLSPVCAGEEETAVWLDHYTEGDGPAPEWWRPEEPMSAEWEEPNLAGYGSNPAHTVKNDPLEPRMTISADHFPDAAKMVDEDDVTDINVGDIYVPCNAQQSDSVDYNAPEGIDPGGIDWNVCTDLVGWDGHRAEAWELDLLARVFYLEFWGTSLPCSEAGCDAILNLWASGKYGRSLFEALSYYDPQYGYTYRVYPRVWETKYDADGLAWCKEFCTGRFIKGPEWSAVYFQLGGYHDTDWVPPLYEMDGVFFSGESEG